VNDVERGRSLLNFPSGSASTTASFALPIERQLRIDAGVNVEAVHIDMHQPKSIEPSNVALRHGGGIAA